MTSEIKGIDKAQSVSRAMVTATRQRRVSGIDKANYPSREAPEQIFAPQEFTDYYYAQSDALQRRGSDNLLGKASLNSTENQSGR